MFYYTYINDYSEMMEVDVQFCTEFREENSMTRLVSYEIWKETPQFETIMRTKDSIWKIKNLSSLECHKGVEGHLI